MTFRLIGAVWLRRRTSTWMIFDVTSRWLKRGWNNCLVWNRIEIWFGTNITKFSTRKNVEIQIGSYWVVSIFSCGIKQSIEYLSRYLYQRLKCHHSDNTTLDQIPPVWYDPYNKASYSDASIAGIRKLAAIKKTVNWAQYRMDRKRKTGSIA